MGISDLIDCLSNGLEIPVRPLKRGPFLFAFDHCFTPKGVGAVATGTVLSGTVEVGQTVEVGAHHSSIGVECKVRGIESFRTSMPAASQGDRVGLNLAGLSTSDLERGYIFTSSSRLPIIRSCIAVVQPIQYFKGVLASKELFHCTIGHTTVMAVCHFFSILRSSSSQPTKAATTTNDTTTLTSDVTSLSHGGLVESSPSLKLDRSFDFSLTYESLTEIQPQRRDENALRSDLVSEEGRREYYAVIGFESSFQAPVGSLFVGSKLDLEANTSSTGGRCRLAFFGRVLQPLRPVGTVGGTKLRVNQPSQENVPPRGCRGGVDVSGSESREIDGRPPSSIRSKEEITAIKHKEKVGLVDRYVDDTTLIVRDLFENNQHTDLFVNMKVTHPLSGRAGSIEGSFGKGGKCKVTFSDSFQHPGNTKGGGKNGLAKEKGERVDTSVKEEDTVVLKYKRNVFNSKKPVFQ
eukprot:GHVN01019383.1.p1 GENE.GHVN01019383.1~~GHVN01019383.1.p1  ORF type:complete len:463 (-),score=82.08 GHVN01019383.1:3085-4473(-)